MFIYNHVALWTFTNGCLVSLCDLKIGLKVRIVYFTSSYFIMKQDDERSYNITAAFNTTHNRVNISLFFVKCIFCEKGTFMFFC